jgi:hypothetical protein
MVGIERRAPGWDPEPFVSCYGECCVGEQTKLLRNAVFAVSGEHLQLGQVLTAVWLVGPRPLGKPCTRMQYLHW